MTHKKESFFWTSYSDLMTSLFFIMLVLFILAIVVLHKRLEIVNQHIGEGLRAETIIDSLNNQLEETQNELIVTKKQFEELKKIESSTEDLSKEYFTYRPEYKKYVLNIAVRYPVGKSDINDIESVNKDEVLSKLHLAGEEIHKFLYNHIENQYLLIIEGQASLDTYMFNYELSYQRALGLLRYWIKQCGIQFGSNCEIQISGSGDGRLDTHSMRELNERENQRFLIHILPKNIFERNESK
ncbi:hypothetical protein [uncultured Bacteroides sp.]|uniref:hypothetical protein n=1 Tax=uncultured Bacteroides sp. TaxID=162156 RepID=UPI0026310073|nr:hypothetical protein [uncultured Bacteroides sp.]